MSSLLTLEAVAETLARAGYLIVAARTPNGREVRCEPSGLTSLHNSVDEDDGPVRWAVQPPTDNYWVTGKRLQTVLDAAGWRREELIEASE